MVGLAAIKQSRSTNRKHTYFFWPHNIIYDMTLSTDNIYLQDEKELFSKSFNTSLALILTKFCIIIWY